MLGRAFFGEERPLDPALRLFLITEFARLAPADPLGPYLVGKQLSERDPALAAVRFKQACPADDDANDTGLDPVFLLECRRMLGRTAYLAGDSATAAAAFQSLIDLSPAQTDQLRARTFLDRITWEKSQR